MKRALLALAVTAATLTIPTGQASASHDLIDVVMPCNPNTQICARWWRYWTSKRVQGTWTQMVYEYDTYGVNPCSYKNPGSGWVQEANKIHPPHNGNVVYPCFTVTINGVTYWVNWHLQPGV